MEKTLQEVLPEVVVNPKQAFNVSVSIKLITDADVPASIPYLLYIGDVVEVGTESVELTDENINQFASTYTSDMIEYPEFLTQDMQISMDGLDNLKYEYVGSSFEHVNGHVEYEIGVLLTVNAYDADHAYDVCEELINSHAMHVSDFKHNDETNDIYAHVKVLQIESVTVEDVI
ncbi:hypothetical protein [Caryophanon tenue]|uniref:Uncharacterized protein n=1 Tax=Caryophanon tenue TaxID=33978 RepID=A0A1C0Y500_9BACL|nr:hypothetical protein [Caryophanon tenue]OCS82257.1 hypothetical protein A6M13_07425 [Caryophanon tenue]